MIVSTTPVRRTSLDSFDASARVSATVIPSCGGSMAV
jgi:hypothetical protein